MSLDPWNPIWKEKLANSGAARLKSSSTATFSIHEDGSADKPKTQTEKPLVGQHKRNGSLLEWNDKERFEIMGSGQIR